MTGVLDLVLLGVMLLSVVHFLLPRHPLLSHQRGRLALRPSAARLFGSSLGTFGLLVGMVCLLFLLASMRLLVGVVLAALLVLRLTWMLWRRWRATPVVFDRPGDSIRLGRQQIGRASQATVVHVTGEATPALAIYLRSDGQESSAWAVPGVDGPHASSVGRAIADYLGVPLVSRMD